MKKLLTLSLQSVDKDNAFVISNIITPQDYIKKQDYQDMIITFLMDKGYRVFTPSNISHAQYGITLRVENDAMRLQITNLATSEYIFSEVIDF